MPGITVAHIQGNHPQSRRSVSTRPILAGQILWLPPKEELRIDVELEDGCYNHPVVVLSPELSNGNVVILTLTSFNGMDLSVKHAHNIKARLAHLPIEPCLPHPDNGILLSLEGNVVLHKNSYVKTENWHTLSFSILRSYNRSRESFVLTNNSYQKLIKYVNFIPVTSPTMNPRPDDQDRLLRLPHLISQPAASLSTPRPNCRCNENSRPHLLEDEERRLHWDGPYRTIKNRPYTQHDTTRSHGNSTDDTRAPTGWNTRAGLVSYNSRYAQYSRPDPWPNTGSYGDDGKPISPRTTIFILILGAAISGAASYGLYLVAVWAIRLAKGVGKSAWNWIRGVSRGL